MKQKVLVFTSGTMAENMKDNGKIIKWKEEASLNGQMADGIKANTVMIKKKDLEFLLGQTEKYTEETGKMENNMDMV